ncbi:MAG: PAS domain-containing protein, partial [Ktedonobacterales bacterium]
MSSRHDEQSAPRTRRGAAVTQASRQRHALASSERLRVLGTVTGQIVWTTPPDGLVVDMPLWRVFTGQTRDEVRGQGWLNAVHPDDRERVAAAWQQAHEATAIYDIQYRLRRHDGIYRQMLVRAMPVFTDDGILREWIGVHTDITERRELEERLRATARAADERARQLEAVFGAMTDGMVAYNGEGRITSMNAAAFAIFRLITDDGYETLPIDDRTHQFDVFDEHGQVIPPGNWPGCRVLRGDVLTGSQAMDVVFRGRNGREVWLSISGAPVVDPHEGIVGGVVIYHDVTDRRALEHRTHEALHALVAMAEALVRLPDENTPTPERHGEASAVAQELALLTCRVLGCSRVGIVAIDTATGRQHPIAVA